MRTVRMLAAPLLALSLPAQGTITPIPNTCAALQLACSGNPVIGAFLAWAVYSDSPTATLGFLVIGFGGPAWNGNAVPQLLDPLAPSLAGCSQLAGGDVVVGMSALLVPSLCIVNGVPVVCLVPQFSFVWPVPQNTNLIGTSFDTQTLIFDPAVGPTVTDACRVTIG